MPDYRVGKRRLLPVLALLAVFALISNPGIEAALAASPSPVSTASAKGASQGAWTQEPVSIYGRLYAVTALSPTDVWAVGSRDLIATTGVLTLHYDGTSWTSVNSIPWVHWSQRLNSVAGLNSSDVWTVGTEGANPIALHWDGAAWNPTNAVPATPTPLPTQTPGCRSNFSDVTPNDPFYAAVTYLYCRGVADGYPDGTFRPQNPVTRAQFAKMLVGTYNLAAGAAPGKVQHFTDMPADSTFYSYIEAAYAAGLVSGYADGSFHPQDPVTRGQLSKLVMSAASMRDPDFWEISDATPASWTPKAGSPAGTNEAVFSDVPLGSPFFPFVQTAAAHSAMSGYPDGTFRPQDLSTRAEVAAVLYSTVMSAPAYSLDGVAPVSSNDVWAVGSDRINPMVLHFDGSGWSRVALPAPLGMSGRLLAVQATAEGLVAVGSYSTALPGTYNWNTGVDPSSHNLVMRYDDATHQWQRWALPGPSYPASSLLAIAAAGGSLWTVGVDAPGSADSVGGLSPAAFYSGQSGRGWSYITPPAEQGGTVPAAAGGSGPADIWVTGWSGAATQQSPDARMYASHYDGHAWELASLPAGAAGSPSRLLGVWSVSQGEAWAVGYSGLGPDAQTTILHYMSGGDRR